MLLVLLAAPLAARRSSRAAPSDEPAESTAPENRNTRVDKTAAALLGRIGITLDQNIPPDQMLKLQQTYQLVQTNPERAARELSQLMADNPGHPTVLSLAAVVADAQGDVATAIEHQEAAMLIDPSVVALQSGLADYYVKAGRLAAARMVYEKIVESPIATAAEKQRAAALLQASLPLRTREALMRGLEANNISVVAPLLRGLAARSGVQGDSEAHAHTRSQAAGELVQAHEALVERCWMRTAAALPDTLPKGTRDDNPYLLFAAARVARFLGEEPKVGRLLRRVIKLTPEDSKGSGELRMRALCMQRKYHEAFAEARRGAAAAERKPPQVVTMFKLEHDAAQLRYLAGKGRLRDRGNIDEIVTNFEAGAEQIAAACDKQRGGGAKAPGGVPRTAELPECDPFANEGGYGALRPRTRKVVQRELNAPRHSLPFDEWEGRPALNFECCDWAALESSYEAGEVVVLDEFLTPDALDELRRLGLESTNWNSVKAGGYIGAFTTDGFAPPVVAQLALDLEQAMPRVLRAHSLLMFWGFKHDTVRTRAYHGIKAHADTAAVNLNFWVTPDEANLDPSSGGLIVYERVSTPESFKDVGAYNNYALGAQDLGLDASRVLRKVAYRQNRAVLFTSALFHATDTVDFKPGFENCRINYTLLFGFMDSVRCPKLDADSGVEPTQDAAQPTAAPSRVAIGPDGSIASADDSGGGGREQTYGGWANFFS